MPEYADIYVISDKRDSVTVNRFLNHFLPKREESSDGYGVPQFSDSPELMFTRVNELVEFCSNNRNIEHFIYWRALNQNKPEHGMVFYLQDGYVIYGLSTDTNNSKFTQKLLKDLQEHIGSNLGYIAFEEAPDVDNLDEFKQQILCHKP